MSADPVFLPLSGIRLLSLAINVPGPVAAARLRGLGASVVKVEPPAGDPLALASPDWYAALIEGQEVMRLDLKRAEDRQQLEGLLDGCDLLLTSTRPAALARLGLAWEAVHERHPRLCQVRIVGHPEPLEDRVGHDLTYQAEEGLVTPPALPRTLLADLAGAERAVSAALGLLLARERGGGAGLDTVALGEAARDFAEPLRRGLTAPGGSLGGGLPQYGVYRAAEGWIALAALEPHFAERLDGELGARGLDEERLQEIFLTRSAAEWQQWAEARDLPLVAVREPRPDGYPGRRG